VFLGKAVDIYEASVGIRRTFSVEEVHETNPAAERCWGVILRSVRAMIAHAGGDEQQVRFWPYLFSSLQNVHNNSYSHADPTPSIPIVSMSKGTISPLPLSKFKVMLRDCYCQVNVGEILDKLSPRRVKGIYLGIDRRRGGHFVWLIDLRRITTVSDVTFDERSFTALGGLRATVKLRRAANKELDEPVALTAPGRVETTAHAMPAAVAPPAPRAPVVAAPRARAPAAAQTPPAPLVAPAPAPVAPVAVPTAPPPPPARGSAARTGPASRTRSAASVAYLPDSATFQNNESVALLATVAASLHRPGERRLRLRLLRLGLDRRRHLPRCLAR